MSAKKREGGRHRKNECEEEGEFSLYKEDKTSKKLASKIRY
jgi:hypothetical protein